MKVWARLVREERGMALVLALGFLVVLGATGASVGYYAVEHQGSASRSYEEKRAEALAEAGLNLALATLFNAPNPNDGNSVPLRSTQLEGGTAEYWGTYSSSTWTLYGRGSARSPAGSLPVVRRRSGKVAVQTGQQGTSNNAIWNYLYADSLTGCMSLSNSVTINIPLYVRGNLCMSNTSSMIGSHLQVGGTVTLTNSATIGSAGTPITEAHIAGGCTLEAAPLHNPCGPVDRVYASLVDSTPTGLVKPPVDLANWYANANPGPLHNCTVGSFPGGFDNDGVMNRSRNPVNLMPTTAYDCRVLDGSGKVIGQLTWTPWQGGTPGTLVVAGTIFFDGDIELSGNAFGVYQGRATIYSSGRISFSNEARLCGSAGCDATWNANQNLLALVAGTSTEDEGFSLSNNTKFQGAVYVVNDYHESNSGVMWGPVIARQLSISNNTQNHYVPFGTLLPGMPASYEEVTVLAPVQGGFGE